MKDGVWLLKMGALIVLLVGCSANGRHYVATEMNETLEVEILSNDSKMFTYRLRWPDDQIPTHVQISRDGRDGRRDFYEGGINPGRNTAQRLSQNVAYVVSTSGYCREGYLELDRSISRYHLWLRGECRESASLEDRERFPGQLSLHAEHWQKP